MSDLRSFVALQARLYEFLAQQDENTLQAIAGGTAQLAVLGTESAPRPPSTAPTAAPSSDPFQATQDLARLPSEDERRIYLNAAKLSVTGLRAVARSLGLRHYSGLRRAKLIDLLAAHGTDRANATASSPTAPAPAPPSLAERSSESGTREVPLPAGTTRPDIDVTAIATRLRETETEEEGAAFLHDQHLDRESLLAVAAELQLTRVSRLNQAELEKRVLKQAIGARRKFAGLRKW
jgi:hypothetical protein